MQCLYCGGERFSLKTVSAKSTEKVLSYDQCSHRGRDRSGIYTVSAKSIDKTTVTVYMINISTAEKIITIHHECPCRIGKSHPRGRNFYQG